MNNGYQKYNGCGADKEGGKIFNTFFYPELQSKHVRPLATNGFWLSEVGVKNFQKFSHELKANRNQIDEGCNIALISENQC